MTGGDIAGLIAAGVFAILVALLALPIIRLTKVFDELIVTIRSLNQSTGPLIEEVTRTVVTTNEQLEKVDDITSNVFGCVRERFCAVLAGDFDCGSAAD